MPKLFSNQAGQGLVSVLVAAAVGAIVLGFMTDMMLQQDSGQKFLRQRITLNDLNSNLLSTFSNASGCTCQFANNGVINPNFANYAGLKFDSTVVDGSQRMPIKALYTGCLGGANAPQILAKENTALLMSPDIIVDKVELAKLRPTGALNEWQGQWEISFKVGTDSLKRSAKPINVTQKFLIDTSAPNSPAAAVITSCVGSSTGAGTTNYLAKWSAVTGVLQDSGIFEASPSGNVGIGTTTPASKLHVSGDGLSSVTAMVSTPNAISTPAYWLATNYSAIPNYGGMGMSPASTLRILSNTTGSFAGSEGISILQNGNVGIGTASPSAELDITKNQDNTTKQYIMNNNSCLGKKRSQLLKSAV